MKVRAFTFIELMVVIAVIALLAALLMPALVRTREITRATACLSNLHQIGVALQLYVSDNQNLLPVMYDQPANGPSTNGPAINVVLFPFAASSNVFRCPSDNVGLFEMTGSSYAWNNLLNGQDADNLRMLSNAYPQTQIPVVYDKEKFHIVRGDKRAINYLYADGHIKNLMELQSAP